MSKPLEDMVALLQTEPDTVFGFDMKTCKAGIKDACQRIEALEQQVATLVQQQNQSPKE